MKVTIKPGIYHRFGVYKLEILIVVLIALALILASLIVLTSPVSTEQKPILNPTDIRSAQNLLKQYLKKQDELLVVLFTTLKMSQNKEHIYDNAIRNWAQLKPAVRPVLYYEGSEQNWVAKIRSAGWWDVYPAKYHFEGVPIMKTLFHDVKKRYPKATFYCYANADILFDESLVLTLEAVQNKFPDNEKILTGQRLNAHVGLNMAFQDLNDVRQMARVWNSQVFKDGFALDYIVATKNAIPWERIPDFLVGRDGYQTWITAYALTSAIRTFDLSNTVLALHQTDKAGLYESKYHKLSRINKDIIGEKFDYALGHISCLKYETIFSAKSELLFNNNQTIVINKREPNPCQHLFDKYRLNPFD